MRPLRVGALSAGRMGRNRRQSMVAAVDDLNALQLATQIRNRIQRQFVPVTTGYPAPFVFRQYATSLYRG